jgi:hypothetical protein
MKKDMVFTHSWFLYAPSLASDSSFGILTSAGDGSFSFSFAGLANYSVNNGFSTDLYYVPSSDGAGPVAKYQLSTSLDRGEAFIPCAVFITNASVLTGNILDKLVTTYMEDDVFTTGFLKGLEAIRVSGI